MTPRGLPRADIFFRCVKPHCRVQTRAARFSRNLPKDEIDVSPAQGAVRQGGAYVTDVRPSFERRCIGNGGDQTAVCKMGSKIPRAVPSKHPRFSREIPHFFDAILVDTGLS